MQNIPRVEGLETISDQYDAILCDVWGVLHNGQAIWSEAAAALKRFRQMGKAVVMITNAPRPRGPVLEQLQQLNCPDGVFDNLVTSGDVTRNLISELDGPVFHIGPERDFTLYDGLNVTLAAPQEAAGIVCTGLYDDRSETPEDYVELLGQLKSHGLPFICANPDIVVEYGDQLLWCAGALAREYVKLGGKTQIVGKPYTPIYEHAVEKVSEVLGTAPDKSRILAIGDGLPTDIAGAADFGIDALFITAGIHSAEYANDTDKLQSFLENNNAKPAGWMPGLSW